MYVDACLVGIGAKFDHQVYAARLPFIGEGLSIEHYEMINIIVAFNLWGREWRNCNVKVYCDNEAVVTCIRSHKIKDSFLMTCVRNLWLMAAQYNISIDAVHIPGKHNEIADLLSRWFLSPPNEFIQRKMAIEYTWCRITEQYFKLRLDI